MSLLPDCPKFMNDYAAYARLAPRWLARWLALEALLALAVAWAWPRVGAEVAALLPRWAAAHWADALAWVVGVPFAAQAAAVAAQFLAGLVAYRHRIASRVDAVAWAMGTAMFAVAFAATVVELTAVFVVVLATWPWVMDSDAAGVALATVIAAVLLMRIPVARAVATTAYTAAVAPQYRRRLHEVADEWAERGWHDMARDMRAYADGGER